MFFDILLLSRQHKLSLHWPWIAATRGVGFVPKDKVTDINIVTVCKHIEEFLGSDSRDPKKRFSLRMSVLLVNGTIRILKKRTEILYDETMKHYKLELSRAVREMQILCTPPEKPKKARKGKDKNKRPIINTPDSWVIELEAPLIIQPAPTEIVQARVEEITLREDDALWSRRVEDDLRDSFYVSAHERLEDIQNRPERYLPQPIPELEEFERLTVTEIPSVVEPTVQAVVKPKRKEKKGPIRAEKEPIDASAVTAAPSIEMVPLAAPEIVVEAPQQQLDVSELTPMEVHKEVPLEETPVIQPAVPEVEVPPMQEPSVAVPIPAVPAEDSVEVARKKEAEKAKKLEQKRRQDQVREEMFEARRKATAKEKQRAKIERALLVKRGKKMTNLIRRVEKPIEEDQDIEFALARPRCDMSGFLELLGDLGKGREPLEVEREARAERSDATGSHRTPSVGTPSITSAGEEERRPSFVSTPTGDAAKRSHPGGERDSLQLPTEEGMPPPPAPPRKKRKVVTVEEVQQLEMIQKEQVPDVLGITVQHEITAGNGHRVPEEHIASVPTQELPTAPAMQEKAVKPTVEVLPPELLQITTEAIVPPEPLQITTEAIVEHIPTDLVPEIQVVPEIPVVPKIQVVPPTPKVTRRPRRSEAADDGGYKTLEVKWAHSITEMIKKWNFEEKELTPEDICRCIDKPINKLNMARIFASLLVLCAQQKVLLQSEEDSNELRLVLPGPNLFV